MEELAISVNISPEYQTVCRSDVLKLLIFHTMYVSLAVVPPSNSVVFDGSVIFFKILFAKS